MLIKQILVSLTAMFAIGAAAAQEYPSRPVKLIVPYPPGGLTDVVIRALAQNVSRDLGQQVVIDNKGGANGTLGALQMPSTAPDGYTLAIAPGGVFRIPFLQKSSFDPVTQLTYITALVDYSYVMAVRGDSTWKSINDLVKSAKADPGKHAYGSPGAYSTPHLVMEELQSASGAKLMHVPYKGGADTVTALLGGQVELIVGGGSGMLDSHVKTGKIRIIASMNEKRTEDYPEAPTLKESGFPVAAAAPIGVVGPAGLDPKIVARLDGAFRKALQDEKFVAMVKGYGMPITYMNPAEYTSFAKRSFEQESARMPKMVKELGVQ